MAIYTRFGEEVQFKSARLAPVWVERLSNEIKHHYQPKQPTRRTKSLELMPFWFVTATGDGARALCEGKWLNAYDFRADDGIREIHETLFKLNPDHAAKEEEWNKADGPQADELFPVIDERMVA